MKNKYLIKTLAISITLATPILAAGLEQSGATLLSDILAEPTANFSAHSYVPTKEEIYEIESLQKDFAINSETHSEFLASHKTIGEEKKLKRK